MTATTRIAVMRGTGKDELGDDFDLWDIAAVDEALRPTIVTPEGGVAATLIERSRTVFDPSTGEPRTVQQLVCRMAPIVVPVTGDRVLDLHTSRRYAISGAVTESPTIAGQRKVRFELKRVAGE